MKYNNNNNNWEKKKCNHLHQQMDLVYFTPSLAKRMAATAGSLVVFIKLIT
jgi:hypothetical protein